MAIPFHSSVRIKLGAGSQILNKDKEPIGINVSAKIIKNKVSAPFRKCDFEIHFGKGIFEHEQLFDILRKHGGETIDGYTIEVGGGGAWKTLNVWNDEGEQILEKKFYKADFDKVLVDAECKQYLDMLISKALIRKNNEEVDIDAESYSEVEALSQEMLEDIL